MYQGIFYEYRYLLIAFITLFSFSMGRAIANDEIGTTPKDENIAKGGHHGGHHGHGHHGHRHHGHHGHHGHPHGHHGHHHHDHHGHHWEHAGNHFWHDGHYGDYEWDGGNATSTYFYNDHGDYYPYTGGTNDYYYYTPAGSKGVSYYVPEAGETVNKTNIYNYLTPIFDSNENIVPKPAANTPGASQAPHSR